MEKLIYVLDGRTVDTDAVLDTVRTTVVPAIESVGGTHTTLLLADLADDLATNPGRVIGAFSSIVALVECWLPTVDRRHDVEAALAGLAEHCWGYLTTESTMVACPHDVAAGERVPGVTQLGLVRKPDGVDIDDFHTEWAVHSVISNDLHPLRQSYDRNAIVRRLSPDAPEFHGIVLERFPSLDVFLDDEVYFGEPAVVQRMIEHLPTFYDFGSAVGGAVSEFRWKIPRRHG